ncbi:MAG: transporter substrate-binding domain-containing protein [Clostridiales bacterium]|jgi:polar amino acid transport system substrate-binding protein|nr:transporter substrate-binding domain-containing protein [Clostridiales bacterium]
MKKFKKIFLFCAAILLGLTIFGCSSEKNLLDEIKERGKIKIGVFIDKFPFGYIDTNGENQGYDVFLAKRIAKDLLGDESKLEFVPMEAANRVSYLLSGKVDVTLANFTITKDREKVVNFSKPYMKVRLGIASPKKFPISNIEELNGKTLIVNKGTTAEVFFATNHPEIKLLKFDQNTEAFNALANGRGDAMSHDNTILYAWVNGNDDFSVSVDSFGSESFIAPAVRKSDHDLLSWLDDEIKKLREEKFFYEDYEKTLYPIYGDLVEADNVVGVY